MRIALISTVDIYGHDKFEAHSYLTINIDYIDIEEKYLTVYYDYVKNFHNLQLIVLEEGQFCLAHKFDYDFLDKIKKRHDDKGVKLAKKEEIRKIKDAERKAANLLKTMKTKEEKDRKEFERLFKKFGS